MKQFVLIVLFLSVFKLSADPGHGLEANYNGKTFICRNFDNAKLHVEDFRDASSHYNWGLCQLHRGELLSGIASLETAARMGDPLAAIILAGYYASNHYDLESHQMTDDPVNLQKGIDYYTRALDIMSQPGYPSDPDSYQMEKKEGYRLLTANNLVLAYWKQFALKYVSHFSGSVSRYDDSTLESIQNVEAAATRCLNITYNSELWFKATYNKRMALCQGTINVLRDQTGRKGVLSLEEDRLHVATHNCRDFSLFDCQKHQDIANKIAELYRANINVAKKLLSSR